ncbi:MAG: NAD-dependent epimerase/dehydratase family protein [Bdellovibrionota bacterium]
MKVLVTGATGFVGQNLVNYLLEQGLDVRVLIRDPSKATSFSKKIEIVKGDVTNLDSLIQATKDIESVFHLAGVIGYTKTQRKEMDRVNIGGTENVIQAVEKNKVKKLLHFSSVVAIGASFDKKPLNEESPYNVHHLDLGYFETKHEAEKKVKAAFDQGRIDTVIVNPSTIYGYGDATKGSRGFQIKVAQGKIPVYPPGGVNVISIEDICEATLKALHIGRSGERYILSGENLLLKEVFEIIAKEANVEPPKIPLGKSVLMAIGKTGDLLEKIGKKGPMNSENAWTSSLYHWFDNSKAKRELQLNPKPAKFAIHNSVQWMKDHKLIKS